MGCQIRKAQRTYEVSLEELKEPRKSLEMLNEPMRKPHSDRS